MRFRTRIVPPYTHYQRSSNNGSEGWKTRALLTQGFSELPSNVPVVAVVSVVSVVIVIVMI